MYKRIFNIESKLDDKEHIYVLDFQKMLWNGELF
jgi:hypothetical protein